MATVGGVDDRAGKQGVDKAKVEAFFTAVAAYVEWSKKGDKTVLPLGDKTAAAYAALAVVRAKIDDYFARCRLAEFDNRAVTPLNRAESEFTELAANTLTDSEEGLDKFPLARIEAGRDLSLTTGINPYWVAAVAAFRTAVVVPCWVKGVTPFRQRNGRVSRYSGSVEG